MTRRCRPQPQLVGADYWLPVEPFEVGWAVAVGCNNLRCRDCAEAVRSDGQPGRTVHRYWCACRQHLETWTDWVAVVAAVLEELFHPASTSARRGWSGCTTYSPGNGRH